MKPTLFFVSAMSLGLTLSLAAAGCGTTTNSSCDYRPRRSTCTDFSSYIGGTLGIGSGGTLDSLCTNEGGKVVPSCDHTGSIGGCVETTSLSAGVASQKSMQTIWYYPADSIKTVADVMHLCEMTTNGTYIAP